MKVAVTRRMHQPKWRRVLADKNVIAWHYRQNNVAVATGSQMFNGIADERFYFVHSYAARKWELDPHKMLAAPKVSWANHGDDFVAAVENGPLWATQFHPEKSGEAGLTLLANWIAALLCLPFLHCTTCTFPAQNR